MKPTLLAALLCAAGLALVTWSGTVTAKDPNLINAYDALKTGSDKVKDYLRANGIPAAEITLSAITTTRRLHQEIVPGAAASPGSPAPAPTVITTDKVEMFTLTQTISISSTDMKTVPTVSRGVTSLIKEGVEVDSNSPSYHYTKLSELKINMLADATKDATTRAEQIVNNAHGRLGKLVEARMGVMQINPKGVSATSAEGNNDTTSYEKEITAIVSVKFEVKLIDSTIASNFSLLGFHFRCLCFGRVDLGPSGFNSGTDVGFACGRHLPLLLGGGG